jgi:hypothetical protein
MPGFIPMWITSTTLGDSSIFESEGMLCVEGRNATPNTAVLTVVQNGSEATQSSPTALAGPAAIVGNATATSGAAAGVMGLASSPDSGAVIGYNTATAGGAGVAGFSSGSVGVGVYGVALATSGDAAGVEGDSYGPGAGGTFHNYAGGVALRANGDVSINGNLSLSGGGSLVGNVGVEGNLNVTGHLSKGSGSFKIDHPLDPANKYLSHSFVESPDMMNIYNGNVVTDDKGEAEVVLPGYFEALNRDFRYQLTVIGQFAQAIVGTKIKNGRFTIRTDKPDVEVSWQVTGIRQDAWANAHRIQVEEDKPPAERGYYLHPELFGAPKEKGIEALQSAPHGTPLAASRGASKAVGQ